MANKRRIATSMGLVKSNVPVRWAAPEVGWLKLNVDASVFAGVSSFTVGMVLRDDLGTFIQGKNIRMGGEVSVVEVEALGILEAV